MKSEDVVVLMNKHVEMKSQLSLIESEKQRLINEAMPAEVRQKVKEIEIEFEGKVETAQAALVKSEEEIKAGVVSVGKTLEVKGLKANFHSGRVSWDAKGLDGVMTTNPEIASVIGQYKKKGNDYASFRFEE
ncbi:MAG: hypothetical protein WD740_05205 [Anaerolineales bacterium]